VRDDVHGISKVNAAKYIAASGCIYQYRFASTCIWF
jgi:hypothetical protein